MVAIGNAWRKTNVLHRGDMLQPSVLSPAVASSSVANVHKNTWDIQGLMRGSWCQVGQKGSRRRGDISTSTLTLDMVTSMARATQFATHARLSLDLEAIKCSKYTGMTVFLHHDATPLFLRFGRLQQHLMQWARYLVKNGTRWISMT